VRLEHIVNRLEFWKRRRPSAPEQLERLLEQAVQLRPADAELVIRLHEALLFLRAYPPTDRIARLADALLFRFHEWMAEVARRQGNLYAFEEPEISGIAGTAFTAVFSYEVARRLASRHPSSICVDWERFDTAERMAPAAAKALPLAGEDWPVEAHMPLEQWLRAAGGRALPWLLAHLSPNQYDAIQIPLRWELRNSSASRTRTRLGRRKLFVHPDALISRREVSIEREFTTPPIPVRPVARPQADRTLNVILDASAVRYRELYGFSHPDPASMRRADLGRGAQLYFFGAAPSHRLPLRAYHAGMFFKNGVPIGYVETLSLFEHADVGFNIYYTFREGENAWLYARLLKFLRQELGLTSFSVDAYQLGQGNEEAIASGAFWFYRKLGFRPVDAVVLRTVDREEQRLVSDPTYRTPAPTLRRLAAGPVVYAMDRAWDRFHVRNLGFQAARLAVRQYDGDVAKLRATAQARIHSLLGVEAPPDFAVALNLVPGIDAWNENAKRLAAQIVRAKTGASEIRYLRLMQRHALLRAAWLRLGSA